MPANDLRKLERVEVAIWFGRDMEPQRWIAWCEAAQVCAWAWTRDGAEEAMRAELDAEERDLEQYGPSNSSTKALPGAEIRLVTRLPSGRWSKRKR